MIKTAFPISACASVDFYTAAMLAKQHGFDGVELHDAGEAPKTREIFAGSRIEIAALNFKNGDINSVQQQIEVASELDCRSLCIKGDGLFSRSGVVTPSAIDQLTAAGDLAATANVCILIENQSTSQSALRLWRLLDRLNHPAIACCWNAVNAHQAGDVPSVAIPMLNSRIRYVQSTLEDPAVQAHKTLNRLRGIGYTGYLLVELPVRPAQGVGELEQALIHAHATLQQWQILPTAVG